MLPEALRPYERILQDCYPYVVATEPCQRQLNLQPLGLSIRLEHRFDPLRVASAPFLDRVQTLDSLTYGPVGMAMPRWALYDCAEMAGALVGLGTNAVNLPARLRTAFSIPEDYAGLVALSMYIAVPLLGERRWLSHSICSINEVAPSAAPPGMTVLTMALGIEAVGARHFVGATQWSSPKLAAYARFAPLRLMTAWSPAHDDPATLAFEFGVTDARIERALDPDRSAPPALRLLDVGDQKTLRAAQRRIEAGTRISVMGPPGRTRRHPLRSHRRKQRMKLQLRNPSLLELRPYLVATPDNRAAFDLNPFGLTLQPEHCFDPLRVDSAPFLDLVKRVDEVTFGPEGMPMPRWVFFDGAELPGGIVGFGAPAPTLPEPLLELLGIRRDYAGLVPLSIFIAIPTYEPGVWMAHNLCSLSGLSEQLNLRGLGGLTKAGRLASIPSDVSSRRYPMELFRTPSSRAPRTARAIDGLDTSPQRTLDADLSRRTHERWLAQPRRRRLGARSEPRDRRMVG